MWLSGRFTGDAIAVGKHALNVIGEVIAFENRSVQVLGAKDHTKATG